MGQFATLDFERRLPIAPATLWAAWTAPAARRIWSAPGPGVSVEIPHSETGVGGLEISLCRVAGKPDVRVENRWLEFDPPHRSVSSELVAVEGSPLSSALVTAELDRLGEEETLQKLTVQLSANRDGMAQDYVTGFNGGLTQLEALTRRLMVIEREIKAPPSRLWQGWTDPERLPLWWGPEGFSCRTHRIDLRAGGDWVFDMIGPDGTVYPNHHRYGAFEPGQQIDYALLHGENGPQHAEAWARFTPTAEGSRVTLGMIFATEEEWRGAKSFGAEELGLQTLGKLAREVGAL